MKHSLTSLFLFCMLFSVSAKSALPSFVNDTTIVTNDEVVYKVTQDQSHLYLNIRTSDTETIMSMIHLGFSVFFDIKGKKKEKVSITYPLKPIRPSSKKNKNVDGNAQHSEDGKAMKQTIARIFENDLPLEAAYSYFSSEEKFNVLLNSLDINVSYTYDQNKGALEYRLKIPKDKINTDSKKNLEKLTIGVKTNKKDQDQDRAERIQPSMGGGGSGGRGGPPNGSQGNGPPRGQGGQGGQNEGPPSSVNRMKPSEVELNFWFPVNQ